MRARLIAIKRIKEVLYEVTNGLANKLLIMVKNRAESKMMSKLLVQETGILVLALTEIETWKL